MSVQTFDDQLELMIDRPGQGLDRRSLGASLGSQSRPFPMKSVPGFRWQRGLISEDGVVVVVVRHHLDPKVPAGSANDAGQGRDRG